MTEPMAEGAGGAQRLIQKRSGHIRLRSGAKSIERRARRAAEAGEHLRASWLYSEAARRHTQTALTWATIALGFAIGSAIFAAIALVTS